MLQEEMIMKPEQRAQLIEKLAAHLLAGGLAKASLRTLAAAVGTSDRMLLYYFRDKADLLETVLAHIVMGLAAGLDAGLPVAGPMPPAMLARHVSTLTASDEWRPFMTLWSEIAVAAGRGDATLQAIGDQIAVGFHAWTASRLDIEDAVLRDQIASLLLVVVDGGALLAPLAGGRIGDQGVAALIEMLGD
jgi:AcrR family transcriptional regulator